MYKLKPYEYITDKPWMKSMQYRMKQIMEAKSNGFKVVLYLYESPDTSTFRYRVYNMCQALEISLEWRGVYFFYEEAKIVEKYLDNIELLILARCRWNFELDEIVRIARNKSIPIIFDVDDMVYNPEYIPEIVNTLSVNMKEHSDYDYWFAYTSRLYAAAKLCDAYITTNEYLANKLQNDLNKKSYIIQNFLNMLQEEVSYNYYLQKRKLYNQNPFTIGYFSGTPSHINDFLVVAPEIVEFLDKYEDTRFYIVGFMEIPEQLKCWEQNGRIIRTDLVNFVDLQKLIAEVDVNIAPLVNNSFSNCKSELKYFEASIVGTVTCATPTWIYREVIKEGINGFLCDRGKWFETLERLYMDRGLCTGEIVENARKMCLDKYSYMNQTKHIEEVYNKILESR